MARGAGTPVYSACDMMARATLSGYPRCLQNLVAFVGMLFEAGASLVIEIVEKADDAPKFFVGSGFASVGAHASFDGKRMFPKAFR